MTKKNANKTAEIHPDTVMHEIRNAIRRLSKILKQYHDVGTGLETQVELKITGRTSLSYTLNYCWPASIREAVKKVILTTTAAKFPQIIATQSLPIGLQNLSVLPSLSVI
jgi:hypothetical protein